MANTLLNGEKQAHATESLALLDLFRTVWKKSTEDNDLSLYGFRRFKTTHLLNIRFLEEEIATIDHDIYQAGLKLNIQPSAKDRLGLKHCMRDDNTPSPEEVITPTLILKLRDLIKQYDDALEAFNKMMNMETISLIDDPHQANLRTDLGPYEIFKTRLVKVNSPRRSAPDPLQEEIHKRLRNFRYWRISRQNTRDIENASSASSKSLSQAYPYQDSSYLADWFARFIIALVSSLSLVIPLIILSFESSREFQLIVVSISIVGFSLVISSLMRTANYQTMAAAAAYAAVVSGFVSNCGISASQAMAQLDSGSSISFAMLSLKL